MLWKQQYMYNTWSAKGILRFPSGDHKLLLQLFYTPTLVRSVSLYNAFLMNDVELFRNKQMKRSNIQEISMQINYKITC